MIENSMLKHASPLRSSKSFERDSPLSCPPMTSQSLVPPSKRQIFEDKTPTQIYEDRKMGVNCIPQSAEEGFNERGVDCDGLVQSPNPLQTSFVSMGGDVVDCGPGWGIGPVITTGKAIVRRGLSFSLRKDSENSSLKSGEKEKEFSDKTTTDASSTSSRSSSLTRLKEEITKIPPSKSVPRDSSLKRIHDSDPLKTLLKMPGIHAEVRLHDSAVTSSPTILNPDNMSLVSSDTASSGRNSSRSWNSIVRSSTSSQSSTNSNSSSTEITSSTIRVFAKCLRSDIEYKTLNVGPRTSCGELVATLLSKYRMKHRDPNLFYLTMEVTVKRFSGPPFRSLLVLEEGARPAQLAMCRALGDARFTLQMRKGGVIKVHDTVLMPGSQYKSLLVSYRTTVEEVVQLMLNCYNRSDSRRNYAIHQLCKYPTYEDLRLSSEDRPLEMKNQWSDGKEYVFVLRRNMNPAICLRKLAQIAEVSMNDDARTTSRPSSRSSSVPKAESPLPSKVKSRCNSVPSPPPRSRLNINQIHHTLLDNSLRGDETTQNSLPTSNSTFQNSLANQNSLTRPKPTIQSSLENQNSSTIPNTTNQNTQVSQNSSTIPNTTTILSSLSTTKENTKNSLTTRNCSTTPNAPNPLLAPMKATHNSLTTSKVPPQETISPVEVYKISPESSNHKEILSNNSINSCFHSGDRPIESEPPMVIDCTLATPVMKKFSPSDCANDGPQIPSFVIHRKCVTPNNGANIMNFLPHPELSEKLTWIEKTWSSTACQTNLSYLSAKQSKILSEKSSTLERTVIGEPQERSRPKLQKRKQVNFSDELQIEGVYPKYKSRSLTPPSSNSDSEKSFVESPGSSPPPSIPPPPLTPPTEEDEEEEESSPPPLPTSSPPPLTPETNRKIKPCIKYPKIADTKSFSAPSSPLVDRRCTNFSKLREFIEASQTIPIRSDSYSKYAGITANSFRGDSPSSDISPPPVPPPPTEECLKQCLGPSSSITDDIKLQTMHNCERNCKNCFYI